MSRDRHASRLETWVREGRAGSPPTHAATVILVRDVADGLETLMLRRNSKIAFGGMWVFPGGRVDPADQEGREAGDLESARCAAVREAYEEAGVRLAGAALRPFSHWTPPAITPKRFLTWFFLAAAPEAEIVIDGGEIHEHAWLRPDEALARRDAGEIELAPPTWVTLHELSRSPSVDSALARAESHEPERFETHIVVESAGPTALWHGDAGWDDSDPDRPGPRHRLRMHGRSWHYERGA